jgi:hypothetical protein
MGHLLSICQLFKYKNAARIHSIGHFIREIKMRHKVRRFFMNNDEKLNKREKMTIADTCAIGFSKDDMMELLKMIIPAATVLLIAAGAYKHNYTASGKFFGLEINLCPHN